MWLILVERTLGRKLEEWLNYVAQNGGFFDFYRVAAFTFFHYCISHVVSVASIDVKAEYP